MFPIQLHASFNKIPEKCHCNWVLDLLLEITTFEDSCACPELNWFSVDNFESTEAPGLAQSLHICDAFSFLDLH